jgi:hypothetical protein
MAQRHHYVPEFYQKGFTSEGRVWKYDRRFHSYKRCYPKENCFEWDLYAVRPDNGPEDRRIETHVLSQIDGAAATVIKNIAPGTKLARSEIRDLVAFIGLQFTRMPLFFRAVKHVVEANMDEFMRMRFNTVERAEDALAELEAHTGETRSIGATEMREAVIGGRIRAHANETFLLEQMFDSANILGLWLERSAWTILVAPQASNFILSDHPFVSIPPQGSTFEAVSYGTPGVTTYFPLTKRLCLKVKGGDYGFRYTNVDSRVVRTVNLNSASNSERFILAADRQHLEAVVERSETRDMEPGERFTLEIIHPDENNSFVKFTIKRQRCFY